MSGCLSGSPCDDILTLIGEQVMVQRARQRARQDFSQVLKHIEEGDESDRDLLAVVLQFAPMIPAKTPNYMETVVDYSPFWEWDDDGYGHFSMALLDGEQPWREWDEDMDEWEYKEDSIFYRWGNNWWGCEWRRGKVWEPAW
jgi:hypothetical protein